MTMQNAGRKEPIELLLVISGSQEFHEQVQRELARRHDHLCVTDASSFEGARRAIQARSPAVILLDECALTSLGLAQQGRIPTLWAAATSLAECAPLVVVGSAEHRMELGALAGGRWCGLRDLLGMFSASSGGNGGTEAAAAALAQQARCCFAAGAGESYGKPAGNARFWRGFAARTEQSADRNPWQRGTASGGIAPPQYRSAAAGCAAIGDDCDAGSAHARDGSPFERGLGSPVGARPGGTADSSQLSWPQFSFRRAIFVCQAVTVSVRRVFLSVCRGIREKLEYAAAKFIGLEAECPGMKCSRNNP